MSVELFTTEIYANWVGRKNWRGGLVIYYLKSKIYQSNHAILVQAP